MEIKEFMVERWLNTFELGAHYNLAETDAKPFTLEELLSLGDRERLLEDFLAIKLGYNPTTGSEDLRQTISRLYQSVTPEEVLVTNGAIEADFLLANVLVEPGDTVIVQFPAYQVLYSVAEARGARVKRWTMDLDKGYRPDLDQLAELIDDRTKLVVINTPHNPTGAVISREDLETILGWAEERGFWVLSDEVYHGLAYGGGPAAPGQGSQPPGHQCGEHVQNLWPLGPAAGLDSRTRGHRPVLLVLEGLYLHQLFPPLRLSGPPGPGQCRQDLGAEPGRSQGEPQGAIRLV